MAGLCRFRSRASSVLRRIVHRRSFGAAALRYDSDHEYDYEEELVQGQPKNRLLPKSDACGSSPGQGVQWLLIGNPGVQKHVYAERLSKLLEVPHISMGSLVRQELNPRSSLYKLIANAVNEGKLVPEEVIFGLLTKRLEEGYYRGESGFILEGIPRTRIQAEILDQIADIDLVVNFKCDKCMLKRQLGSGICSHCEHSSDSTTLKPSSQETQLGPHSGISDGARGEKLRVYAEQNNLLEDYYKKQRKLLDIKVAGGPGETWQGLLTALHLQHKDTLSSSQKLRV